MQESLFSPMRAPAEPSEPRVEGVSRVVNYIQRLITENKTLASLRVRGEVSDLKQPSSGHLYFDLKENADVLKCVVWASNADRLPPFKNGDAVIVSGGFNTFTKSSTYQLLVDDLEHTGIGKLYAEFEALKERFRREGLFETERKRPMPAFPRRIAVVSALGKGAEDFLKTMKTRAPHVEIEFVETRVQGEGAEIEIADAIDRASRIADVEAIVVTRGGGSYQDLFPFNLEPVVRAIVRSKKPVLSAIGHTGDVHVSDLVADKACETPSNAAHYFGEIRDRYLGRLERAERGLQQALRNVVLTAAQRVDYASNRLAGVARHFTALRSNRLAAIERRLDAQTPKSRLEERARRLHRAELQLDAAVRHVLVRPQQRSRDAAAALDRARDPALRRAGDRLRTLAMRLEGADPKLPLARGYAIVTYGGKALRDAGALRAGETIEAVLQRGSLTARVETVAQPPQDERNG